MANRRKSDPPPGRERIATEEDLRRARLPSFDDWRPRPATPPPAQGQPPPAPPPSLPIEPPVEQARPVEATHKISVEELTVLRHDSAWAAQMRRVLRLLEVLPRALRRTAADIDAVLEQIKRQSGGS